MSRITLLTLALSVAPVLCWAAEPQFDQHSAAAAKPQAKASDNDAAQLKTAQDERIKVLTQTVEILTSQYNVATADFSQVFSAESDLCNALLDSTDEPEKRVALLTKQLEKANDFVKIMQSRIDSGSAGEVDLNRTKLLCLDIKIKLLRERSKKGPPTPTGVKISQGGDAAGANEEYKLVGGGDRTKLESTLNELAKQGWKVRASAYSGQYIILAR